MNSRRPHPDMAGVNQPHWQYHQVNPARRYHSTDLTDQGSEPQSEQTLSDGGMIVDSSGGFNVLLAKDNIVNQ